MSDDLLKRIVQKRQQVDRFLTRAIPRRRRLLNATIFGGAAAAALTAGPAVGGEGFTAWLTMTFGLTSPAWQLLCGAAAISSVTATVATQILRSQGIDEHVNRAQRCRAKLEMIEVGLSAGQLDTSQATAEFMKCVEEAAFLETR